MSRFAFVIFISMLSSVSFATQNFVGVETTEADGEFVAKIQFDGAVDTKGVSIEYQNNGIQVVIPNAVMKDDQKLVRVNTEGVKSVLTTNKGKDGVRTKVFFNKEVMASEIEGLARLVQNGNELQLRFNKNIVSQNDMPEMKTPVLSVGGDDQNVAQNETPVEESKADDGLVAGEIPDDIKAIAKQSSATKEATEAETAVLKSSTFATAEGVTEGKEKELSSKNNKKETEIPVLTAQKTIKEAGGSTWVRMFGSLFVIGALAFGMVLFSKWYQKKTKTDLGDNRIRILTQHYLGPRKSLAIVRVAGETILIGVTEQNISMLKSLSLIDDEIPVTTSTNFEKSMSEADKKSTAVAGRDEEVEDDFVIGNIKDRITTKLKDFRPLS